MSSFLVWALCVLGVLTSATLYAAGATRVDDVLPDFVPRAKLAAAGHLATHAPPVPASPEARVRTVASEGDLRSALVDVRAGDVLEIASGAYTDFRVVIPEHAVGTLDHPIILRAASGGVTFKGASHIHVQGRFVIVQGFVFEEANVPADSGDAKYGACIQLAGTDNRVTQSRFIRCGEPAAGWRHIVHMPRTSQRNRVDSCAFLDSQCIPTGLADGIGPDANVFSHNLIEGNNRDVEGNWRVAIQISQGASDESGTIVEYNTIRNFAGPESIGIKSTRCVVRNNLVVNCDAPLGVRAGSGCEIRDNVMLHVAGGIMLTGRGHVVEGNCVVADRAEGGLSPVFLHCEAEKDGKQFYQPTIECVIRGNILAVLPPNSITPVVQSFAWLDDVKGVPSHNRFEGNLIVGHKLVQLIGCWDQSGKTTAEQFVQANTFVNNQFWMVDAVGARGISVVGDLLGRDGNRAAPPTHP